MKFTDYDCIGFDLDNTLVRYKLTEMVEMEYRLLGRFLIETKGYASHCLERPMQEDIDFVQRGLIIDFAKGNILKIAYDGYISKACHGTRQLSNQEIELSYGPDHKWNVTTNFCEDLLAAWHGPLAENMRTLLDYFDMSASLAFARIVDTLDEANNNQPLPEYNIWPDIIAGSVEIFTSEHLENDHSKFYACLKADPERYLHRSSDTLKDWLTELRKHRTVFLLTGSPVDFTNIAAPYAFGENWRDYFDAIICYAKKPGFFMKGRPFFRSLGTTESTDIVDESEMRLGEIYTQGNWNGLMKCLAKKSNTINLKVLYIGDNLLQDIYSPNKYCRVDTVSITEEMLGEGMVNFPSKHDDQKLLCSSLWGTYFLASNEKPTIWFEIIRKHSKLCVPNIDWISKHPIDHEFKTFSQKMCTNGFYPSKPKCFSK